MEEFSVLWGLLSPRARQWVLWGRMTVDEALYLSDHDTDQSLPALTDDQVAECMQRAHGEKREKMLRRHPEIGASLTDVDALKAELFEMAERIQKAFIGGRLTFLQARYAKARGFRGIVLTQFLQIGDREGRLSVREQTREAFVRLRAEIHAQVRQRAYLDSLRERNLLDPAVARKFEEYGTPVEGIRAYVEGVSHTASHPAASIV